MRVRTRLLWLASMSVLAVISVAAVLSFAWYRVDAAQDRARYFEQVQAVVDDFERSLFDFERDDQRSAVQRWAVLAARLNGMLDEAPLSTPRQKVLINSIESHKKGLDVLFDRLGLLGEPNGSHSTSFRRHLLGLLQAQVETIREDARRLVSLARQDIERILWQQWMVVVITLCAISVLVGHFTLRVIHSIGRSLDGLRQSFQDLAQGQFEPVPAVGIRDEFDEIRLQYNRTLVRLRELTVSRDALQALVEERTAEIRKLAEHDPLTGVANRRALFERGQRDFLSARRHGHDLSVLMLDCDHFKQVNDGFGHAIGDQALVHFCRHAEQHIREVDLLARYGGEEFVIVLLHTDVVGAVELAERLRLTLTQSPLETARGELRLSTSIGVASRSDGCESFEQMLLRADKAVYRAKALGRNRTEVAKP